MYQYYQVLLCLLKFDFFAFNGVTIQVSALAYFTLSFSYLRVSPIASHRCPLQEFSRVWPNNSRDSRGSVTSLWLWDCCETRNQVVRFAESMGLSFFDMPFLRRLMTFSLFLMLASETYCEWPCLSHTFYSDSAPVQSVCCFDWPCLLSNLIRSSLQIGSFLCAQFRGTIRDDTSNIDRI